ncbi:serine hydrolase [Bacteroides sp. 224]|uniref:serine hydrolase domain-containing protein n=1 Tax=Bacteroides sp. 224 TaxID=2302936 RepID=UPI0013D626B8|nr:serine hydrolase [Bacteroides sp. 224]NDV64043.1 hypothetical protein [Bacteroides sp. 224]
MKKSLSIAILLWFGIVLLQAQPITVLGNYAPVIPLTAGDIAVLSIGKPGSDGEFLLSLEEHTPIKTFRINSKTTDKDYLKIANELKEYRRVIVSVTGETVDVRQHRKFLSSLKLRAPLIYVVFSSYRMLHLLVEPLEKAAAVVVTHELNKSIQKDAADVLLGKKDVNGKLSMPIEDLFPEGSGEEILKNTPTDGIVADDYGMKSHILNRKIGQLIENSIQDTIFPGCQVLILKDGIPVVDKCYGTHAYNNPTPVIPTSMYDLAEISQTTGTLLAIMKLYDSGLLKLNDKLSDYLPDLKTTNKKNITIREVLLHESGLAPYIRPYQYLVDDHSVQGPFFQGFKDKSHYTQVGARAYACSDFTFKKGVISYRQDKEHNLQMADGIWVADSFKQTVMQAIAYSEMSPKRHIQSNIGFVLLQQVIENITGMPLHQYLYAQFFEPMELSYTLYHPIQKYNKAEIVPTVTNEYLRRQDIHGYVHDEMAACLGGVAGNAGLFSTAREIGAIHSMLLNKGVYKGIRYLKKETCRLFTTGESTISHRGLGFDRPDLENPLSSPCSASTPAEVYGQTGFTGSCVWTDPINNIIFVFLTNSICPNVWNDKIIWTKTREKIQEFIYQSMEYQND